MIRRLLVVAAWLLVTHAGVAALAWGLLHVPEASVWMLALSALLLLASLTLAGWAHAGAARAWVAPSPSRALAPAWRGIPAAAAGAVVLIALWFLADAAAAWHQSVAGQIDAWFIARFGWTNTGGVHGAIRWAIWFLRWGIAPAVALAPLGAWAAGGYRALASRRLLRQAARPLRWVFTAALVGLGLLLPWQWVYWRPEGLPIAVEPWFVAVKLGGIAALAAVSWAGVTGTNRH